MKNQKNRGKIRVNITVDRALLAEARTKLRFFGGKLSTLFNAYLADFVTSMDKEFSAEQKRMQQKIKELESRVKALESVQ